MTLERPLKRLRTEANVWEKINSTKYDFNGKYLSASKTANYLLDDPIIDWLENYYEKDKSISYNKELMYAFFNKGFQFENLVIEELKKKFPSNIVEINNDGWRGLNRHNFKKTIECIKEGIPIISQAVLYNDNNFTYGISDLLIRSDFINRIFNNKILQNDEEKIKGTLLNGNYHYIVIDIKWTTLHFCSKTNNIRKVGRVPAYKSQLAIYNCALGNIQGYFSNKTYILGKGWNRETTENKLVIKTYSDDCFDTLGEIDYDGFDNIYIEKTINAIKWYNELMSNGKTWDLYNPSNSNMYPNMHNSDIVWDKVKKEISDKIGEITKIFKVGIEQRRKLHHQKIFSIYDKNINSRLMGFKTENDGSDKETMITINDIIEVNTEPDLYISPEKIKNRMNNWHIKSPVDFYFDFETLNTMFLKKYMNIYDNKSISDFIFNIGIGWIENDEWKFKSLYVDDITLENEEEMIDTFFNFITSKSLELDPENKYYPRLFHWTNAERKNLLNTDERHHNKWHNYLTETNIKFVDMYKVFTDKINKIVVKGAFNFKLKSIGNALYDLKKINIKWEDNNISNGQIAMLEAIKYYSDKETNSEFENILKYNEIDCRMIFEIVNYLRLNHI